MSNSDLAAEIKVWFEKNKSNKNKWTDNEVGKIIKGKLLSIGNWKNLPRGDWRKAAQMKEYGIKLEQGYDGPPPFKPKSKNAKYYQEES